MDIITYGLLNKKIEQAKNVSGEKITEAVNIYLDENPPIAGATTEQAAQIDKNVADISKLKDDLANFDGEPKLIENFVSNEDMDVFTRSESPDGTPYDFKALFIECDIAGSSKEYQTLNFTSNLSTPMSFTNATNRGRGVSIGLWLNKIKTVCLGYGGWRMKPSIYETSIPLHGTKYTAFSTIYQGESIKSFELNFNDTVYSGTVIKIYGVKI